MISAFRTEQTERSTRECVAALRSVVDTYVHVIALEALKHSKNLQVTAEDIMVAIQSLKQTFYGNVADALHTQHMDDTPLIVSRLGTVPTLSDIQKYLSS